MLSLLFALGCSGETGFNTEAEDATGSIGDARLELEPASIVFTGAVAGVLAAEEVTLRSVGSEPLVIRSVQIQDDLTQSFEIGNDVGQESITIEPDREDSFLVHLLMASEEGPVYATVTLQTNDADNLTVNIPLEGYPRGWFGGDTGDTGDTGP